MMDILYSRLGIVFHPLHPAAATRSRSIQPLELTARVIAPEQGVRILGVNLKSGLATNEHLLKAVANAIGKCMALRRMRGVQLA